MNSFLPPLPLVDNHLFIDNSFLDKWLCCPRASEYHNVRGRVLSSSRPALNYGGAIHEALATRYRLAPDLVDTATEAAMSNVLTEWFAAKPNPPDDYRQLELAQKTIQSYNSLYRCESFRLLTLDGKPAVELPFVFRLYTSHMLAETYGPIQVLFCGKIDLLIEQDGVRWVVDHKTSSIFGDQHFRGLSVSPQMLGYVRGWQKTTGELVNGFIVNSIKVPKPTKKDGIKIEPTTDYFNRMPKAVAEYELEEWEFNTIDLIEEFLWHYSRDYTPQKKAWCMGKYGPCEFFEICELARPADRLVMLQSDMYTDNVWSPLNEFHNLLKAHVNV